MKLSKRFLSLVMVIMFVTAILAGCGENTSSQKSSAPTTTAKEELKVYTENGLPKDQSVTLKIGFAEQGYGREWYDNCVAAFTKKFPNVKFDTQYSPTIREVVKTKVAANSSYDMFDMFYYPWNLLVDSGNLEPLDDLLDRELYDTPGQKVKDILLPGIADTLVFYKDKHLYNLPQTTYFAGLFYDQVFFEQNGWNKQPRTWSEFLKLCADIKSKGIAPIAYAGMYDYENFAFGPKQFELAAMKGNKDYMNNYRNFVMPFYSSPENLERWSRVAELGKNGYIDPSSVSINHTQSQMMAIQHTAALVASGDWIGNEMKDSTPQDFKWGFMAVPFIDDPSQTIYITNGGQSYLNIYSKKPEINRKWAKEFLLWLYNMESQQQLVEKAGAISLRKDYVNDESRVARLNTIQKSEAEYMKNFKVAFVDTYSFAFQPTHPDYAKARKLIIDNNALMATGKKDPKEVLDECDKLVKSAVDAYKAENK